MRPGLLLLGWYSQSQARKGKNQTKHLAQRAIPARGWGLGVDGGEGAGLVGTNFAAL